MPQNQVEPDDKSYSDHEGYSVEEAHGAQGEKSWVVVEDEYVECNEKEWEDMKRKLKQEVVVVVVEKVVVVAVVKVVVKVMVASVEQVEAKVGKPKE